jgi:AraC-like DNA-binding protein
MYQFFAPHTLLRTYISHYWMRSSVVMPGGLDEIDVFTDLQPTLTFNFGEGFERFDPTKRHSVSTSPVASLESLRTRPVTIRQTGAIHIVAVQFLPGALAAFLPMSVDETTDLTVDLHDVFGQSADDLTYLLYDARHNPAEQATLLDTFLLHNLRPSDLYTFTTRATPLLSNPTISVDQLARESGYSARNLNRIFRAVFGINPKTYARIARFRRAYHALQYTANPDLTQIAHTHGYYDLSHFSREFKTYTGAAPSQYRQQMSDLYKRFREADATISDVNNNSKGIR